MDHRLASGRRPRCRNHSGRGLRFLVTSRILQTRAFGCVVYLVGWKRVGHSWSHAIIIDEHLRPGTVLRWRMTTFTTT